MIVSTVRKVKFYLAILLVTASSVTGPILSRITYAANAANFNAGNIIDDVTFWNKNAMSVQEIQSFLNSKVPSCDTWGQKIYSGSQTRAQYGVSIGNPTPFICLKDYIENPDTKANNLRGGSVTGGRSAAQLIYDVAQSTGVSPKVIIVMLQKEQGLITDDWPFLNQYRSAMGYGCPDTAACDSQYYGFYNQIYNGANVFNIYKRNINNYRYKAGQNNNILWNPNAGCGSSTVYIENQATAGLYIYTPYRPNQAALNNLYGIGDGCSAYGNRNFWRYFTDWFGSTRAADYDYSFVGSTAAYKNLDYGQKITSEIMIKNTGSSVWYADGSNPPGTKPTRLSTGYYRDTAFASPTDPNWLGTKNQIKMTPAVVNPGENATFTFELVAPNYRVDDYPNFIPVVDGIGFMKNIGMTFSLSSNKPKYQFVTTINQPSVINPGQAVTSSVVIKNTGNAPWYSDSALVAGKRPVRLASLNYSSVPFASPTDPNWLGTKNQIKMTPAVVNPGENATFTFELVAPNYRVDDYPNFIPVVDGIGFMKNTGMTFSLSSDKPKYQFVTAINQPSIISPGQSVSSSVIIKNTGNAPWYSDSALVVGKRPMRLASQFYNNVPQASPTDPNWLGTKNQILMTPTIVNPGENATFSFELVGPSFGSTYIFKFLPVMDGVTFLNDNGMQYNLYTPAPTYKYAFVSALDPPAVMRPGQVATTNIKLKNTGTTTWRNETTRSINNPAIRLIMSQPWYRGSNFADLSNPNWITNGQIKLLTTEVKPGEIGEFSFTWKAPATPGTYFEHFAPVADGVTLMDDVGMVFRVTVQ
jgi:hypothetical protein